VARRPLCSVGVQPCVYQNKPGAAAATLPRSYRPRQPHRSVLHRVVRDNLETFLAQGMQRSANGEGYPLYVEKEFRDFVACGDLSRGFARVRCGSCGHEMLLPFSCKNRGLCPSCTGRRMSDEAAYLVDMVLPEAPYRQWTLTFPFTLRFLLAKDYKLITAVLGIAMRILFAYQRRQARRAGVAGSKNAAVVFVQRFGGALNCNVHAHALLPDGVFVLDEQQDAFRFVTLPPPSDKDILRLTQRLARRVTALLERRFGSHESPEADVLEGAIGQAMLNVPRLDPANDDEPAEGEHKVRTSRRRASVDGFCIHADTAVPAHNRVGLEKLCRYGLRPAFSHQRLSLSEQGRVLLALRRPWPTTGGVSVLCFEPLDFLRRLAPLIPPPYANLVRHFGLFAPNAKNRDLLPAAPPSPAGIRLESELRAQGKDQPPQDNSSAPAPPGSPSTPPPAPQPSSGSRPAAMPPSYASSTPSRPADQAQRRADRARTVLPWAELLRRVFAIDALVCPKCLGPMTVIAYLTEPAVLEKILTHLGLPCSPPPLAPARPLGQIELFDDRPRERRSAPDRPQRRGRAPPKGSEERQSGDVDYAFDWGA
jgi:hypothetical protein